MFDKNLLKFHKYGAGNAKLKIKARDSYRWLEKIETPKVKEWVRRQNNHTRSILDKISARNSVKKRLERLFQAGEIGVPIPKKNRFFFTKRGGSDELEVLYVQDGLKGNPKILINPNRFPKNKKAVLRTWHPSANGKFLAYCLSKFGNDQSNVHVLNVDTGKKLPDFIPSNVYPALYSPIKWAADNKGFWYTRSHNAAPENEKKMHQKVYFHRLGESYKNDTLFFGETIAKEDIPSVEISDDSRYLLLMIYKLSTKKERTELYLFDSLNPKSKFIPIIKNLDGLFFGQIHKNKIYILTNYGAPLWKIMSIDINKRNHGIKRLETVIPEGKYRLEKFKCVGENLFIETLENAHSVLKYYRLNGIFISKIKLPTIGSITSMTGKEDGNSLFFGFTSFLVPHNIYHFDLKSGKLKIFKKTNININVDSFNVSQRWCKSGDNTKIPIFVIHKKNIKLNGDNPAILYGYGGFDTSLTPHFYQGAIPFLETGGIYATANVRGGGEFGEKWHKEGALYKKQNSFTDFISAAKWLADHNYTNQNKLGIFGWSNGGLLVGAAITQQPRLFKAAIIGAPVLDMLRYHLFFGGRQWIAEYGNPEKRKMFKYLLSYSPYHNVKNGENYPAALIVAAYNDDRVHPMHAFKMAAKLQEANASSNPIILRTEINAGHSGAATKSKTVDLETDIWSFIFARLGINIKQTKRR